ncbi:MAG: hypothetical protein KatS3mg111_4276 [Pirellulaceae bacterium]|nr:MAG: hypothetical protein KatS3mg111_4276 [Pirellulaceae bacterium]
MRQKISICNTMPFMTKWQRRKLQLSRHTMDRWCAQASYSRGNEVITSPVGYCRSELGSSKSVALQVRFTRGEVTGPTSAADRLGNVALVPATRPATKTSPCTRRETSFALQIRSAAPYNSRSVATSPGSSMPLKSPFSCCRSRPATASIIQAGCHRKSLLRNSRHCPIA